MPRRPSSPVTADDIALPDGRVVRDFHQIRLSDFVVVFAEDPDGRFALVRQYKHGPRRVSLTLPGGHVDPGETAEAAARRELLEEAGLVAERMVRLGALVVDGNHGCGAGSYFHATGVRRVQAPDSGDLEEQELVYLSRAEIVAAQDAGEIALMGVAAGLWLLMAREAAGRWGEG